MTLNLSILSCPVAKIVAPWPASFTPLTVTLIHPDPSPGVYVFDLLRHTREREAWQK